MLTNSEDKKINMATGDESGMWTKIKSEKKTFSVSVMSVSYKLWFLFNIVVGIFLY